MSTILSLWLPILLSAIAVFFTSFIVWMVLPYHRKDYSGVKDEDALQAALREQNLSPGLYNVPHCATTEEMKSPEMQKKMADGPVAFITVIGGNPMEMGKKLAMSFTHNLLVACFLAFVLGSTLHQGPSGAEVFHLSLIVTWLAYGAAFISDGIWFGRPWKVIAEFAFDALLYALVTAAIFTWLWPAG